MKPRGQKQIKNLDPDHRSVVSNLLRRRSESKGDKCQFLRENSRQPRQRPRRGAMLCRHSTGTRFTNAALMNFAVWKLKTVKVNECGMAFTSAYSGVIPIQWQLLPKQRHQWLAACRDISQLLNDAKFSTSVLYFEKISHIASARLFAIVVSPCE